MRIVGWVLRHPLLSILTWLLGFAALGGSYWGLETVAQAPLLRGLAASQGSAGELILVEPLVLKRFPDQATERVFEIFGNMSEFREAISRYGYKNLVPHMQMCVTQGENEAPEKRAKQVAECGVSVVEITLLGLRAQAVLADDPVDVVRGHLLYGGSEEWRKTLELGDLRIAPVLKTCFQGGGDWLFNLNGGMQQAIGSLLHWRKPELKPLTPEQCGWYAVQLIAQTGTDFLSQFAVKDGVEHRLYLRTLGAYGLRTFFEDVLKVEEHWALKEAIPLREKVWAGVETATALLVFTKPLLGAKLGLAASGTAKSTAAILGAGTLKVAVAVAKPFIKTAAVLGFGYYVVAHPVAFTEHLGQVARALGANPLSLEIAGWVVVVGLAIFALLWTGLPILVWRLSRSRPRLA